MLKGKFAQWHFYSIVLLLKCTFSQRHFYSKALFLKGTFAQRHFCSNTLLLKVLLLEVLLLKSTFAQRYFTEMHLNCAPSNAFLLKGTFDQKVLRLALCLLYLIEITCCSIWNMKKILVTQGSSSL